MRVCDGRYPLGRLGDLGDDSECEHVIDGLLYLVSVLYGHLPSGLLDWGNRRVHPDGVGTRHVACGVK